MEINAKKIRCCLVENDLLKEIDIDEFEKDLDCKLLFKAPTSVYGVSVLNLYSENFEEEDTKKRWLFTRMKGKPYEWLK